MKLNYIFNVALVQGEMQIGQGPANVVAESLESAISAVAEQVKTSFPDNGQQHRHLMVFTLQAITVPRTSWEEMQAAAKADGLIQRPN